MKRIFLVVFCLVVVFSFSASAYCQDAGFAKVIYVEGSVSSKASVDDDWTSIEVGMLLAEGTIVKAEAASSCEVAFDGSLDNVIGIKENTEIVLESPIKLYLSKGRVFTLINLDEGSTFEVHTPTAIGGARGTGWLTDFLNGVTTFKQFEGSIYASGKDRDGNPLGKIDLPAGFSVEVEDSQEPGDTAELGENDFVDWNIWRRDLHLRGLPSLAEAIQDEMGDVFDPESGFAAGGRDFVYIPPGSGAAGPDGGVSSGDITLTEEPPPPDCPPWDKRCWTQPEEPDYPSLSNHR